MTAPWVTRALSADLPAKSFDSFVAASREEWDRELDEFVGRSRDPRVEPTAFAQVTAAIRAQTEHWLDEEWASCDPDDSDEVGHGDLPLTGDLRIVRRSPASGCSGHPYIGQEAKLRLDRP